MVVAMIRDPLESAVTKDWASTEMQNRLHSTQWTYTATADGAIELNTGHLGEPYGHTSQIHRIEIDVVGTQGSNAAVLLLHWNSGPFADHDYLIHSYSMVGNSHEVVPLYFPLPVPHEGHFHLTIAAIDNLAVVKIHLIEEWI